MVSKVQPPINFFHIGFPKTATTFLQRHLFVSHPEINPIGKPNPRWREFGEVIFEPDRIHFSAGAVWQRMASAVSEDRVNVFSEEHVSTGIGASGIARVGDDRLTIAERLHQISPRAEIIVTLRNQLDLIPSYWHIRTRGKGDINRWVAGQEAGGFSEIDLFLFSKILDTYSSLFGKDRVRVLLYEDFLASPQQFTREVCRILGADSAFVDSMEFGPRTAATPKVSGGKLDTATMELLRVRFQADNLEVQSRWGLPLSTHGYQT